MYAEELKGFLRHGKLIGFPSRRKKQLIALGWLSEFISIDQEYTEREFNELLNRLHTFHDPAALRRKLFEFGFVLRTKDGSKYWLNPERPTFEEVMKEPEKTPAESNPYGYSERDLEHALDLRNRIHAEALERVQQIAPDITEVLDRYEAKDYFQQIWDYPGAWYTMAAIPESAGSREALIDQIVRDTLKKYRQKHENNG